METVEELEELLTRPSEALVEFVRTLQGDIMILGAGGKIGPSMAGMAKRAMDRAGATGKVIAVDLHAPDKQIEGVEYLSCDLLDIDAMGRLPRAENLIFMAGRKFGSTGSEHLTWAINTIVPYHVARTFTDARVVVFSTGCVYPVVDVAGGGATEETPPNPIGEYAQSCLGRERMFDYYSHTAGLKVLQFRLNYAVEPRYGVLVDVATKVFREEPVDVTTGFANVLWQGDVCSQAIRSLALAASPPRVLNVTGPETISIRRVAEEFGCRMNKTPIFTGLENGRGFLSNATRANAIFGNPTVPLGTLIDWTAGWVASGGENLGKPTHFETQDGKY
ncbi:MAG: NAD(P)-dependent oxidoreductase [Phycisphaerae bacterium]|nr:NAD(P)-dependent oxidoreductase [Phycisphaerae bacterium]